MPKSPPSPELERSPAETALIGGHPAIDFVNTVHWRSAEHPLAGVVSYPEAVRFAARCGLLPEDEEAAAVLRAAAADPAAGAEAFAYLVSVREAAHGVLGAPASGEEPDAEDVDALRGAYAEAVAHGQLAADGGPYRWSWDGTDPFRRVARPLAVSAIELFLSPGRARVKRCGDERCGWLFLDKSKNGSRRWCSMDICGARNKMRAHYHRTKGASGG